MTNLGVHRQIKENSTEWFQANGFYGGALTTLRQKSIRTVHYDQIEGDLAHCSIFDMDNYHLSTPNVEFAYKNAQKFTMQNQYKKFVKIFEELII